MTNIAIVYSNYNSDITKKMVGNALKVAKKLNLDVKETITVPGVLEIPFVVKKLLENKNIEGIATLGAVIKGDTDHDDLVAYTAAHKLVDLSLKYNKPVSIGIIGPNASKEVAIKRIIEYSTRAIETINKMLKI